MTLMTFADMPMRLRLAPLGALVIALVLCNAGCATGAGASTARPAKLPQAASNAQVAPALDRSMDHITTALMQVGWQRHELAFSGFLPTGNHATFAVEVPAGQCVTLVAIATKNVQDVDAALYTPDGELLAVDSEPNPHPTIQTCATAASAPGATSQRIYYVIQLYDGDGSFLVVPFYGKRAQLTAAARVLGGKPAYAEAVRSRELIDDPLASLAEGLRKRGYEPIADPLVFQLAERERLRTELSVELGKCYTVAAFGAGSIQDLTLRVVDTRGRELTIGGEGSAQTATQLCAHETAGYAVEAQAQAGQGQVTLIVYRADHIVAGGEPGLWLGRRTQAEPTSARPTAN